MKEVAKTFGLQAFMTACALGWIFDGRSRSSMWTLVGGLAWSAAGVYGLTTYLRHRAYIGGLPATRGNRIIKRQHTFGLIGGVGLIAVGVLLVVWYLAARV